MEKDTTTYQHCLQAQRVPLASCAWGWGRSESAQPSVSRGHSLRMMMQFSSIRLLATPLRASGAPDASYKFPCLADPTALSDHDFSSHKVSAISEAWSKSTKKRTSSHVSACPTLFSARRLSSDSSSLLQRRKALLIAGKRLDHRNPLLHFCRVYLILLNGWSDTHPIVYTRSSQTDASSR
jgi:hypothetical protein